MLHLKNLTFRVGGRTLIENASAHIPVGHHVGLVGPNGSGKTSLLRLITGQAELDGGDIELRSGADIGVVAQDAPGGEQTPLEATLAADEERARLISRAQVETDPHAVAEIQERLVDIDAHAAPARAATILAGLGFDEKDQHRPLSTFSGGWRMRVALAAVLFQEPDLLLLDEPTNHLDLESALWLEQHLANYPGTLLMVSHDKSLLNSSVDHILHLHGKKLEMYTGGYDAFQKIRAARNEQNEALRSKQDAQRKRMVAFIERFRAKATKARQAQSRVKQLERMEVIVPVEVDKKVRFDFPAPAVKPSPLVKLDSVSVGYNPGSPILKDLHLSVFADDRVALLGANGNGKTTLARLLVGELREQSGQVVKATKTSTGYFAQDHLDQLETQSTAYDQMKNAMPDGSQSDVRSWLGRFGLEQAKAEVPVSGLSGGEKTRLALALMCRHRPNLLVLDEPTNHLDVDSRDALVEGLMDYEGAVVLVSHDRHLIEATADQLWLVDDGTVMEYRGDLDEYAKLLLEKRRSGRKKSASKDADPSQNRDKRRLRKDKAQERARLAPLKKVLEETEALVEVLTEKLFEVESVLADPATYEDPSKDIKVLTKAQKELAEELEKAEEKWLEAQAAYDDACED